MLNPNSEKIKLFYNSDDYWDVYWSKIDKAQKFIFVVSYDMDNKMIANITLRKLIEAVERGVQVFLIIEHLNFYLKNSLTKEFQYKGGIIVKPNPIHKAFKYMINFRLHKFFNRFHQKVTLVDNTLFIGSINIAEEYSNIKYGTMGFIDLNIYLKNSPSQKKVLKFFHEIISENIDQVSKAQANLINNLLIKEDVIIKLDENGKAIYNDEVILSYRKDDIYEEFLEEKPPEKSEIQDSIYSLLESAESSITIVAPYYLNLKRVDDLLVKALKRGVKVQIFTSLKRDQPAYKYFYNSELFKNLMNNGAEVYEFMDKVLHLKAYYVDQKLLNLGSMNNDITSFVLNNEANYLIRRNDYNTSVFRKFDQILLDVKDNSRRLNSNIYKNPFRVAYTYWWYFFIYMMETTVANRKPKHNN